MWISLWISLGMNLGIKLQVGAVDKIGDESVDKKILALSFVMSDYFFLEAISFSNT